MVVTEFFVDLVVSAVIDSVVAADAILAVVEAVGIVVSAVVDVLPVVYETVVPVTTFASPGSSPKISVVIHTLP